MSKINPAARLYDDTIRILKSLIIKYSYKADQYETFEVRSEAETYIAAYNKKDTFFSYQDYTQEDYRKIGVMDEGDIITYVNNQNAVPPSIQQQMLEYKRKEIIGNYDEPNEYYRMLNGLPPLGTELDEFVYVPVEYCNQFSIPKDLPIHLIQDQLGDFYITLLESNGVIDRLIEENPDKEYLKHLGTKRIDVITARRAKNFSILYFDPKNIMESIHREFVRTYDKCREYFMNVCYIYEYRSVINYYDNFIVLCIFLMTMQQVSARMISNAQDREFYDDYSIQLLYETYGVPFNKKIDELTQKQIVQNVNLLVQNKASNKVLLDIASILGFESIKIYEYYLMKERQFDLDGRPVIKTTEKWDETIGKYVTVPDYENMYDVHFQRVPIDEQNLYKALQDPMNRLEYLDITTYDPFWWEDDDTYHEVWESEYNMIETKYLGVTVPFRMSEMLFQSIIQFHMIFDKSPELADIFVSLPKITAKKVQLFDTIILLCALMCKKYHLKGNIISAPSKVLSVLEILDRDINHEIPKDVEILKFDFESFNPTVIQDIRETRMKSIIDRLSNEDIENLKRESISLIFKNPDGSFYSQEGYYFNSDGSRIENVYRNRNTGNYYKLVGSDWYYYDEAGELLDTYPKTLSLILSEYNEGRLVHSNENDLRIKTLYENYQNGKYELIRTYIQDDSMEREELLSSVKESLLRIDDIRRDELMKNQIKIDEGSESFINGTEDKILVGVFPKRLYRYVKYSLDSLIKENNYYKYFELSYEYDKTNGLWTTDINPDPLLPSTNPNVVVDEDSLEVFSVYINGKTKFEFVKSILDPFLNDKTYRIVNGHDIDLLPDGKQSITSYKKIREVIDDVRYMDQFYNHLTILSSQTLGITPEEKVKSLNALYENAKELYYFITFRIAETTDYDELYALRKLYDTIFFAKETNSVFTLKDKDGKEVHPETFLEYLQLHDLELYEFVNNIEEDSIYLYIDHIIYHLEDILDNVDYLYILNDGISPLQELLVQLIQFFKSYTTDMVKFSSYMIMDWKMENLLKFIDHPHYVGKTDLIKDVVNLQYSDFIKKYTIKFTLDEKLKMLERLAISNMTLPNNECFMLSDETNLWYPTTITIYRVVKPFILKGNNYEDGYFILRFNYEDVYRDVDDESYYRLTDEGWIHFSKDGEKLRNESYDFDFIEKKYREKQLIIDYGIEKKNGGISFNHITEKAGETILDYSLSEYDMVAEYFTSDNKRVPDLDIPLVYDEICYMIEYGESKEKNPEFGCYFTSDGQYFNSDNERVPDNDDKFIKYKQFGIARKEVRNLRTEIKLDRVIKDSITVTEKYPKEYPDLWRVITKLAQSRPVVMNSKILIKDGVDNNKGFNTSSELGNIHFFDIIDITSGPEEVYKYEDGSFYRFESRAWILYDKNKNKVSGKEIPFSELMNDIENGLLVKTEIYFDE